ncbi:hypothetical protein B0H10DRAFT_1816842 [Mycena sp. CBHHK59/15]|nr:hypothetical protein B0H10DRAFT_1816842 [Mycena sp. CBHHK59/15]
MKRPFPKSIYPCCTFNLGPGTHCDGHLDSGNMASSQCAITVAGNFDHTEGGHLVLHKFKLVIEFPSGATALIPSATVTHSNTPLQEGEEHFSFTQCAAGGLFRWVEYGHMKEGDFKLSDREAWLAATSPAACKARVSAGLARFSKYDELPDNLKTVFPVKDTSSKSL